MSADRKAKKDRNQRTTYFTKPVSAWCGEWINTTQSSDTNRAAISFGAAEDKSFTTEGDRARTIRLLWRLHDLAVKGQRLKERDLHDGKLTLQPKDIAHALKVSL